MEAEMKKILFLGDSITDAGRAKDKDSAKGHGYVTLVAAKLGFEYPGEYEFFNRGISGNRVCDLLARIRRDAINHKPDVISILIGVNDVSHEIAYENGVSAKLYETLYNILIEEVKAVLPGVRILILEPFVLKGVATEARYDAFREEVELRAAVAKRISERNGLEFISLQRKFDEAAKIVSPSYWLEDGVHPTSAGHELIAREWISKFYRLT